LRPAEVLAEHKDLEVKRAVVRFRPQRRKADPALPVMTIPIKLPITTLRMS
jgi:hypothetical protein